MLDRLHHLAALALLLDGQLSTTDLELGACRKESAIQDAPGMSRNVDKASATCRQIRLRAQLGNIDVAVAIDLHERQ